MAIRTILLRKKISDKRKEIETLTAKRDGFDQRRAELETREAEIVNAISEAETEDERRRLIEERTRLDAEHFGMMIETR